MTEPVTATATALPDLLSPAVVAAVIAALVSLVTWWATGKRAERVRRRELLAEAYQASIAYREFPYRVRRRRADHLSEDVGMLTLSLNAIQERLAFFEAWTALEGKKVGTAYRDLLLGLRAIVGPEISKAWQVPALEKGEEVDIKDIDLSALQPLLDSFLEAVRRRVGTLADRLRISRQTSQGQASQLN